jgi:hypothetical protein
MRTSLTIGIAILTGSGLLAEGAESRQITICVESVTGNAKMLYEARAVASGLFGGIGVKIRWHGPRNCPTEAPYVTFSSNTPARVQPGALAYAMPYEGTHIVVFVDRVQLLAPYNRGCLLGYTLAHEITHIVEGIVRHSASGIMKAQWGTDDHFAMRQRRLGFAPEDVALIYQGLDRQESRLRLQHPSQGSFRRQDLEIRLIFLPEPAAAARRRS